MGVSTLMSLGVRALAANYASMQTTGHNIANANVAGYSRQSAVLATAQGQFTGAGFFGRGVDVVSVTRSHDAFLTREAGAAASLSAMDATRLNQLTRLEDVFKTGESGLGYAASDLFNALSDLSTQPADLATRQVVLARASDVAARFREAGSALDSAQAGITADLKVSVAEINSLARSVADVNQRIAASRGLGQPANDLMDQRERLISQIGQHVQVTRMEAQDGSVGLFIGGGQRLVLGTTAAELKVVPDVSDSARSALGIVEGPGVRPLDANGLGGGAIAGLLRFQNSDLANARNLVGRLAAAVGGALNEQQGRGLSMQPPLGTIAGAAMFAMGATLAQPNAANARDSDGVAIGSVALTITDAAALQASDYDLRESPDGSGSWQLTRRSDGQVRTVNDGDSVDGMRIDISNAQPGDRFLLQPVSRAANGMQTLLADPRDVAAASPLVATAAVANTGTAAVAGLTVRTVPLPFPGATANIAFTDDSGGYDWSVVDTGGSVLASGSGVWQPGQNSAIPTAPDDINGFSLQLNGVPRSGDTLSVAPTAANAMSSNNGNAASLLALRDVRLVGGQTVTDSWASAIAEVGVRVQTAKSASSISGTVAQQAEQMRGAQSGVNLDEEAARLIQFQQSYQAAAKVLQVAQALFDTLLNAAGG